MDLFELFPDLPAHHRAKSKTKPASRNNDLRNIKSLAISGSNARTWGKLFWKQISSARRNDRSIRMEIRNPTPCFMDKSRMDSIQPDNAGDSREMSSGVDFWRYTNWSFLPPVQRVMKLDRVSCFCLRPSFRRVTVYALPAQSHMELSLEA